MVGFLMNKIIIENFKIPFKKIVESGYTICFTEEQFQKNNYDFLYWKKYKITHLYNDLKEYNVIQKINDGALISNKYIIINNQIYEITLLPQIEHSKIQANNYIIRFFTKGIKSKILYNINLIKNKLGIKYLPKIFYFGDSILVEEKIVPHKIFNHFYIMKFIFMMYLTLFKNIKIFDLDESNIIIDKNLCFKIIDLDKTCDFSKIKIIIYYIYDYFIYKYFTWNMQQKIDNYFFTEERG